MSPSLTLYNNHLAQPGRAVAILCRNIGVQHEDHIIDMAKGEHKSQEYLAINPFGKIPAVKDGEIRILESCAAMKYIASKYDSTGKWYPKDLDIRVKVDEYMDWQHLNTRAHGLGIYRNKIILPHLNQSNPDMEVVKKHSEALAEVEKSFLSYFLGPKPYIACDHITIADLLAACDFEQPKAAGYALCQPILEYLERVRKEIGPNYDELHTKARELAKIEDQRLGRS